MEHYGDVHLHHTSYPDFPGQYEYEGTCRYDSGKQDQYDKYDKAPTPPGMDQCHVEHCHPGSWQGVQESSCDGVVKQYQPDAYDGTCDYGLMGDQYDKYDKGDTQTGLAPSTCGKPQGVVPQEVVEVSHGPRCGCPGCSHGAQVAHAQVAAAQEGGSMFDLTGQYQLFVTLFALAVMFLVGRMVLRRLR